MITKELIDRINELSRKQRSTGLTPEEKEEQASLRQEYLAGFRANFKAVVDNVKVVTPEEYERMQAEGKVDSEGHCTCGCRDGAPNSRHIVQPNSQCGCGGHGQGKHMHGNGQGHGHGHGHKGGNCSCKH